MVLEYCGGTDLDQILKRQGPLCEKDAKRVIMQVQHVFRRCNAVPRTPVTRWRFFLFSQVLSALAFLNGYRLSGSSASDDPSSMPPPPPRRRVIHYDLVRIQGPSCLLVSIYVCLRSQKPANILFDDLKAAKVTDFGLSKVFDDTEVDGGAGTSMELTSQGAGTYWYLPPECFATHAVPRVSSKVDVWAVGVIFFQTLYGRRPFGDTLTQDQIVTSGQMLEQARAGPQFPERPAVSRGAQDFIRRCLTYSADARPDVLATCRDPFLLQGPEGRAANASRKS